MKVIGVIDLAGGAAVHARRGARAAYRPVHAAAGRPIEGDALALARTYVDHLAVRELYVADLDAITDVMHKGPAPLDSARGRKPGHYDRNQHDAMGQRRHGQSGVHGTPDVRSTHESLVAQLSSMAPLWLDAAISDPNRARRALELGATRAVVGLETLESLDALPAICEAAGRERAAFSIDLRDGAPVYSGLSGCSHDVAELASYAVGAGAGALIVVDLARVGSGMGPDLAVIRRVRNAAPGAMVIAGGGVRGPEDVMSLAEAGCDGALVATAFHNGSLRAGDVRRLRHTSDSL